MPTADHVPTLLLVDDTPAGLEVLRSALATEGYALLTASNGEEALALAASHRPDLMLLDVMMPGIDGFEVCRRVRADERLRELPVVMVTALGDRPSRLRGLESGADDFLTKPVDRLELRLRVRTITRLTYHRRQIEQRLLARAADGERLAAVLKTTAGVAHDIKNSLAALRAGVTLLAMQAAGSPAPPGTADGIRREFDEVFALLQAFSRLARTGAASSSELPTSPVDVGALLATDAPVLRHLARPATLTLTTHEGGRVLVSESIVHRIVANLLRNAAEAGASAVTVETATEGSEVTLTVRDTGPGMPAEVARRAFEPYFTTRADAGGMGLGLAMVEAGVRASAGTVTLESAPGAGTTIRIRWPRAQ